MRVSGKEKMSFSEDDERDSGSDISLSCLREVHRQRQEQRWIYSFVTLIEVICYQEVLKRLSMLL